MSARVCVVNVSVGSWFPKGQERLAQSLKRYSSVDFKGWTNEYPPGCHSHQVKPYEFKRAAIGWALDQGYDIAIWADSSCWFVKDPTPLIQKIEKYGYWFCSLGWNVGQWCSDAAMAGTGHAREKLFEMPMVAATFYGLDLRRNVTKEYLSYMRSKQQYFAGPYRNDNWEASVDARVLGHRHDQTFLSILVAELGLGIDWTPCFFAYAVQAQKGNPASARAPNDTAIAIAQGM